MGRALFLASLTLATGCSQVDYIDIKPKTLVLRQRNNEIWLQGHAMSHTGVHYSRATVTWSTKDPSIAVVDEKGRLTPVKSGLTEVVAKHGDVQAAAPVEVLFAEKMTVEPTQVSLVEGGPSVELHVKVYDYKGRELTDRTATFRSLNKEIISMGQNAVFGLARGTANVEVQVEELKQTVAVTVENEQQAVKK
ncbi:MAG: Ig-like domain-containing protein [Myxococcota bacterium]